MYAEFITSDGSLSDVDPQNHHQGYLAFLRLVGTAYFLMHRASHKGLKSPVQLYNSCEATTVLDKHIEWLNKIREHVWVHTHEEKYLLPSHTALKMAENSMGNVYVGTSWDYTETTSIDPRKAWLEESRQPLHICLGFR